MLWPCDTTSAIRLDTGFFIHVVFDGGLIVTVKIHPAQAILLVTIRPAWRWNTTATCKVVRMR
jgi:hypothetical protein